MTPKQSHAHLAVLEALRPEPVSLDRDWSTRTLESIVRAGLDESPPRKSRRKALVVGATVAAVLSGGAAYAGGFAPKFVIEALDDLGSSDAGGEPWGAHDPVKIADLMLPDGRRFAVWRGSNDQGGQCEAVAEDWDGHQHSEALSVSCWPSDAKINHTTFTTTSPGFPVSQNGPDPDTTIPIIYGQSPEPAATHVVITGADIHLDLKIDEFSHGFAAVLPRGTSEFANFDVRFMSATGNVLYAEQIGGF